MTETKNKIRIINEEDTSQTERLSYYGRIHVQDNAKVESSK